MAVPTVGMRRNRWIVYVVLAACAASLQAQNRPPNRFEVATIKPIEPNPDSPVMVGIQMYPGGRVVLSGMSLQGLVGAAFRHPRPQMANSGEAWIESDRYRIEARPPADANITNINHSVFDIDDERVREMLQALLLDRFRLRVRRENRTGDVYQLTRTNKPLALQPAKIPEGRTPSSMFSNVGYVSAKWSMQFMTMDKLAEFASAQIVRAPVVNMTETSGQYDYSQKTPDQEPAYSGLEHTDSFLRMLKDIGLELKRTRGPVEWLVIESAARPSPD